MELKHVRWLGVGGGAAMVLGSFLPWLTLTAVFIGTITKSGVDQGGDGVITAVAGVVAAVSALSIKEGRTRTQRVVLALAGGVAAAVCVIDGADILDRAAAVNNDSERMGTAGIGYGLYVVGAGALASVAAALSPARDEVAEEVVGAGYKCRNGHPVLDREAVFCRECGAQVGQIRSS